MKHKERLDVLLVARNLAESRSKAQAMIMAGEVYVNEQKADKAGLEVNIDEDPVIEVRGSACPYVSRGGLKLEKALRDFGVDPTGFVCSDSGASTGGFTDCLLQQGASKVFAIDVGYGQLAWKIRSDPRVVVMERTNIRYVTPEDLGEPLDLSVVDVSFISLKIVLPAIQKLLKPTGQVLCLIKPQFEAGKENVGKKGVVRRPRGCAAKLPRAGRFPAFYRPEPDVFSGQGPGGQYRIPRASFHAAGTSTDPGRRRARRAGA